LNNYSKLNNGQRGHKNTDEIPQSVDNLTYLLGSFLKTDLQDAQG
jgi:hypothetical protein